VLTEAGADGAAFPAQADTLRTEVTSISRKAEADGVFGVPSFVVNGELYWGREHLPDISEILSAAPTQP
jgi:2-hydroxychromene-2-carboxylate isomerase